MSWTRPAFALVSFTKSTWFHLLALGVVSLVATTPVPTCAQPLGDPAPLQGLAWQSMPCMTALPKKRRVLLVCAALAANCRRIGAHLGI